MFVKSQVISTVYIYTDRADAIYIQSTVQSNSVLRSVWVISNT